MLIEAEINIARVGVNHDVPYIDVITKLVFDPNNKNLYLQRNESKFQAIIIACLFFYLWDLETNFSIREFNSTMIVIKVINHIKVYIIIVVVVIIVSFYFKNMYDCTWHFKKSKRKCLNFTTKTSIIERKNTGGNEERYDLRSTHTWIYL